MYTKPTCCLKQGIKEILGTVWKFGYGLDLNTTVWNDYYFLIYDNDTVVREKNVLTSRGCTLKHLQVWSITMVQITFKWFSDASPPLWNIYKHNENTCGKTLVIVELRLQVFGCTLNSFIKLFCTPEIFKTQSSI